jgi:hypothetical protein
MLAACLTHSTPDEPCHGNPRIGFPDAGWDAGTAGCISFRGVLESADPRGVRDMPGIFIDPDYDANYALGIRPTQVSDRSATIRVGSTIGFGIHSPFFFFGGNVSHVIGKECDFWLSWNKETRHLETDCHPAMW